MKIRGFTLLEIMIAAAILAVLLVALYSVLFSSEQVYDREMALREAEVRLQAAMDRLLGEVRESGKGMVRVQTFTDPNFAQDQTVVVIVSARNADGLFQSVNARPQWQKLVVYAPVFNASLQRGELGRYEVGNVPPAFTDPGAAPAIVVTADQIQLEGLAVDRIDREKMLDKLELFDVTLNDGSVVADITVQGNVRLQQTSGMQSGVRARN